MKIAHLSELNHWLWEVLFNHVPSRSKSRDVFISKKPLLQLIFLIWTALSEMKKLISEISTRTSKKRGAGASVVFWCVKSFVEEFLLFWHVAWWTQKRVTVILQTGIEKSFHSFQENTDVWASAGKERRVPWFSCVCLFGGKSVVNFPEWD